MPFHCQRDMEIHIFLNILGPAISSILQVRKPQRGNASGLWSHSWPRPVPPINCFTKFLNACVQGSYRHGLCRHLPGKLKPPCKTKPSWAKAERESSQETHSGEAFVQYVTDTMKEPMSTSAGRLGKLVSSVCVSLLL